MIANSIFSRIQIVIGDITDETGDAIVNAANTDLYLGGGVAGAIKRKGGLSIQAECDAHGPIGLGEAALTNGGRLPAKQVIHAAVMRPSGAPNAKSIREATLNALRIASEQRFKMVSFPALGTGIGGFSMVESAEIMLAETCGFLSDRPYPEFVRFVLYEEWAACIFRTVFEHLQSAQH